MTTRDSEYWDDVGRDWKASRPDALWRAHSDAVNAALLEKWLPTEQVCLLLKTDAFDEANSAGLFALLTSRARMVVEIDISAATLLAARNRHPALMGVVCDVRKLPLETNGFDVIFSNSTLDHFRTLDQLETALVELHRVLRPGGQLLLTLDNPLNPVVALRNVLPFNWLNRTGIVPYFVGATCGSRKLAGMLQNAGFEVAQAGAVLHCPRMLAVAVSRMIRSGTPSSRRFLSGLMHFERLGSWPTRYLTGYFTTMKAIKRGPTRHNYPSFTRVEKKICKPSMSKRQTGRK